MDIFVLVLKEMIQFLVFIGIGLLIGKKDFLPKDAGTAISRLITHVFLPALCFSTFAQQMTAEKLSSFFPFLFAGVALILLVLPLSQVTRRVIPGNKVEKLTIEYSSVVTNTAYVGYPLVLAILGQEALAKFMFVTLPFSVYIYAYSFPKWDPSDEKPSLKIRIKKIFNPLLLGILAGIAIGLSGVNCPSIVLNVCKSASNCLSTCSMIVAGLAISKVPFKKMFSDKRVYIMTAIRLFIVPAVVITVAFFVVGLIKVDSMVFQLVSAYVCFPLGLNPVIFAEAYEEDGSFGTSCAMVSMLCSLITLPTSFTIIAKLVEIMKNMFA